MMASSDGKKRRAADSFPLIRTDSSPVSGHENRSSLFIRVVHHALLPVGKHLISDAIVLLENLVERLLPYLVVVMLNADRHMSEFVCKDFDRVRNLKARLDEDGNGAIISKVGQAIHGLAVVALQTSCEKFSYNLQKRNGA